MKKQEIQNMFFEKLCSAAESDSIADGHILVCLNGNIIYLGSIDGMDEEWPEGVLVYLNTKDYDSLVEGCDEVKEQ